MRCFLAAALLSLLLLQLQPQSLAAGAGASSNETAARLWFDNFNAEYQRRFNATRHATWAYNVDINDANELADLQARLLFNRFRVDMRKEMDSKFNWTQFSNATLRRMFAKASDIGMGITANESKLAEFNELVARMTRVQSSVTIEDPITKRQIRLSPDVTGMMADQSVDQSVKKQLWQRWREASGRPILSDYRRYVQLGNELIQEAGYANVAEYWQSWYEARNGAAFEAAMRELWQEVLPMYKELHAYMRHKLRSLQPTADFPDNGQIPGHLLGHMWAGRWDDLEPVTKPFPSEQAFDITAEMRRQGWTVRQMFEVSEEFFASLGLGNMTRLFWQNSVKERIPNVEMVCHASAWDFYSGQGDFRIKQCTEISEHYLAVTHHEMGHIQYYQQYEHQPVVFRRGANPGFHEAVGDVVELSVMTPTNLRRMGLLTTSSESREFYLNYLYLMALKKAAYLPFAYLIDQWRWKVFKGEVAPEQFNEEWVRLRCQLMGVCSPVLRGDKDFDPGAVFHVAANVPYIRYFVSYVLQFQLHKALCNAANVTDDIHKCNIYGNAGAGAKLKTMLSRGSSLHWEDTLEELSGSRRITAQPMIEYFKPLMDFIREENRRHNVQIGWKDDCPDASFYEKSAAGNSLSSLAACAAAAVSFLVARLAVVGNF